jgi:predicted DNA binding CopG/RHH family protein
LKNLFKKDIKKKRKMEMKETTRTTDRKIETSYSKKKRLGVKQQQKGLIKKKESKRGLLYENYIRRVGWGIL